MSAYTDLHLSDARDGYQYHKEKTGWSKHQAIHLVYLPLQTEYSPIITSVTVSVGRG